MFLPKGQSSLEPSKDLGTFSNTSLNDTEDVSLLAISIPTVFLPGIGACILTSLVAMAKAISLCIDKSLLTLVPECNSNSYWVTVGPICTSTTLPIILKSFNTFSSISIFFSIKL